MLSTDEGLPIACVRTCKSTFEQAQKDFTRLLVFILQDFKKIIKNCLLSYMVLRFKCMNSLNVVGMFSYTAKDHCHLQMIRLCNDVLGLDVNPVGTGVIYRNFILLVPLFFKHLSLLEKSRKCYNCV